MFIEIKIYIIYSFNFNIILYSINLHLIIKMILKNPITDLLVIYKSNISQGS